MEGDAARLRRQVQAQLAAEEQQRPGGGIGGGQGAAGHGAADAAQQVGQHRHTGAQLAAHPAVTQQAEGRLPHRQAQQRRQQQTAAQHYAAQERGVQPRGRQHLQLLPQVGGQHFLVSGDGPDAGEQIGKGAAHGCGKCQGILRGKIQLILCHGAALLFRQISTTSSYHKLTALSLLF